MAARKHPEDIKAAIRKRHKSIAAFERNTGLPCRSVKDVLRGKSRPGIARAIADDLGISVQDLLRAVHFPKWGR
jgi:lambda repressor-like predicted transcriptional regulator